MKSRVPIRAMPWVVAVVLMLATMPAAAQEDPPPDDATVDVTAPTDEAPAPSVEDAPADVVAPAPAPPAPSAPVLDMSGRIAGYVQAVRGLPGTLFAQENRLDTLLQSYRLGAITRDRLTPCHVSGALLLLTSLQRRANTSLHHTLLSH